jgi:very-short-patch-repair endonuclease
MSSSLSLQGGGPGWGLFAMRRLTEDQRDFSRALRKAPTDAERRLWSRIRQQQLHDARFRRQHPIGPYFADFACVEHRLVVELDGGQHADSASDAIRDEFMQQHGWRVLRYWNNDVMANIDGVLVAILQALDTPPPQPSHLQGEGA